MQGFLGGRRAPSLPRSAPGDPVRAPAFAGLTPVPRRATVRRSRPRAPATGKTMRHALMTLLLMAGLAVPGLAPAQSADQQVVSVVDSPDPVIPGQNITY